MNNDNKEIKQLFDSYFNSEFKYRLKQQKRQYVTNILIIMMGIIYGLCILCSIISSIFWR